MNIELGKLDWAGAAAFAGVVVAALTAIVNGLISRSRAHRLERLAKLAAELPSGSPQRFVVERLVLDHAERLAFQQSGPSQVGRTSLFWIAQVCAWACTIAAYLSAVVLLQPLLGGERGPATLWVILVAGGAFAGVLFYLSGSVRRKLIDDREDWIAKNAKIQPPRRRWQS